MILSGGCRWGNDFRFSLGNLHSRLCNGDEEFVGRMESALWLDGIVSHLMKGEKYRMRKGSCLSALPRAPDMMSGFSFESRTPCAGVSATQ